MWIIHEKIEPGYNMDNSYQTDFLFIENITKKVKPQ